MQGFPMTKIYEIFPIPFVILDEEGWMAYTNPAFTRSFLTTEASFPAHYHQILPGFVPSIEEFLSKKSEMEKIVSLYYEEKDNDLPLPMERLVRLSFRPFEHEYQFYGLLIIEDLTGDILYNQRKILKKTEREIDAVLKDEQDMMYHDAWFRRKSGERIPVEVVSTPVQNDETIGHSGTILIFKDITDKRKTEEYLKKTDKLSLAGQLAAGIAHEIRNPMTSIKGFMQLLRKNPASYPSYMSIILSELDRIEMIVNELLVLARPKNQQFQRRHITDLLDQVNMLMQGQAHLQGVQVVTEYQSNLPEVLVDGNSMKQIFVNILKNAIESMPLGGMVRIQVQRHSLEQLLIRFQDQGVGIPAHLIPRLGEPFHTSKENGTGLGLMISHQLIRDHHGVLTIQSKENHGTTVDILLPIAGREKLVRR